MPSPEQLERALERALYSFWTGEKEKVMRYAKKGKIYIPSAELLEKVLRPFIVQAVAIGAVEALPPLIAFGLAFDESAINWAAVQYARQHIYYAYDRGITAILTGTTRKQVQEAVSQWLQDKGTISELAQLLEPTLGRKRAQTVAVTEVTNAIAGGNIAAWREVNKQMGKDVIAGKRWVTANDERVCPICAPLGGLTLGASGAQPKDRETQIDKAITSGLGDVFVHPGGNGPAGKFAETYYYSPPAHPRCRCRLAPVVEI